MRLPAIYARNSTSGKTGRRVMGQIPGSLRQYVSRKEKNTLITDHYTSADHNGIQDMNIHILDFVHMNGKTDAAKKLRLKIEAALIHRLDSSFPDGLNYLD